jgi:hypothetical protein
MQLSQLAYDCILKLARITTHLAEALQYRPKVMLLQRELISLNV